MAIQMYGGLWRGVWLSRSIGLGSDVRIDKRRRWRLS